MHDYVTPALRLAIELVKPMSEVADARSDAQPDSQYREGVRDGVSHVLKELERLADRHARGLPID